MKRADVEALADQLSSMLAAAERGDLEATPEIRHELAGAVAVLRVVLGNEPDDVIAAFPAALRRPSERKT